MRLSFGPSGEFFMEIHEDLSDAAIDMAEKLYRRILTARSELKIVEEAMRDMNEDSDGGRS